MPPTRGTIRIARTQGSTIPDTSDAVIVLDMRTGSGSAMAGVRRSAFAAAYGVHVRLLSQTFHSKRVGENVSR
jgi:hypothetical protein